MCGICGYIGSDEHHVLPAMCGMMRHRGPDDEGVWHDPQYPVGLGQRRLSIIDVSQSGHQPMSNEDGTVWITFNGEIYDFRAHRERLLQKGHVFRSGTDTEVLVHLYEEKGIDFLDDLNGMFAFALWDSRRQRLLLARDHAGIKPLYYWRDGDRLFFASEIKALLRVPGIPRVLNYERIPDFLSLLWVPGEETLLAGINKLEPGHHLLWKHGNMRIRKWFNLAYEPDEAPSETEWIEQVHDTLLDVTRRQMVSDVPLGVLLSGGVDSSSLVALMRQADPNRRINCYTSAIAPEDNGRERWADDYTYARKVAQEMGANLKTFVLKADVAALLPKMVYHLDEPDADPAVFPSYLISRIAREDNTKVLMSGVGADELFFGYNSHRAYRLYSQMRWIPRRLSDGTLNLLQHLASRLYGAQSRLCRRARRFRRGLVESGLRRHLSLVEWSSREDRMDIYSPDLADRLTLPEEPPPSMVRYFQEFEGVGDLNRHSHVLIQSFLASHNFLYVDKSSMAAGVEVRVPFMDLQLMRLCARIPERYKLNGRTTKYVFKKAMERDLPGEILYRPKTGFGAPLRTWIARDFSPLIGDLLSEKRIRQRGLFDAKAVQRIIRENQSNRTDDSYFIYALMTLEIWLQTFLDRPGVEVAA